jgi:hypothetical protein
MGKIEIALAFVPDPGNAIVSKQLLDQLESLRKKAVDIGKDVRAQLSSAWTSANDASKAAVKQMTDGLGSLQKIGAAQDALAKGAKERMDTQVKFLSGMGELASSSLSVVKNIAQLGTESEKSSVAVDNAFKKIEVAFKAFEVSVSTFNKGKEQLEFFKQLRNVESPPMNVGAAAGLVGSKLKGFGASVATKGGALLGDISPGLQEATEKAATKLKSMVGVMGSRLQDAASAMGEKFGTLGTAVGGALGKVGSLFGGLTGLAGGLVAVIASAVASIAVSLDKMFNNGRVLRAIKAKVSSIFGLDQPTGDVPPEQTKQDRENADRALDAVKTPNALRKEVREAQRDYFATRGREKDFDIYDLGHAHVEVINANAANETFKSNSAHSSVPEPAHKEARLSAYDHVKEAQERILETTRQTTRELQSQLGTQHQQVAAAQQLVEQEKARFEGRKADFGRLPKEVQDRLVAIAKKVKSGKDISDEESEYSDKYGFFRAATTKHYAGKLRPDQISALQGAGESGVEAAVKAVADAKANEKKIQEALESSVQREKTLTEQILKTRMEIVRVKGENLGEKLKVNTELPNLGSGGETGTLPHQQPQGPAGQGQAGDHRQAAADFAHEFDTAVIMHLLPAMKESMRGLGARITNAGLIG